MSTVKSEQTTTSKLQPPAYNNHQFRAPFSIFKEKGTSEQRPPVNNGHNFKVLRVIVVLRFDCKKNATMRVLNSSKHRDVNYGYPLNCLVQTEQIPLPFLKTYSSLFFEELPNDKAQSQKHFRQNGSSQVIPQLLFYTLVRNSALF